MAKMFEDGKKKKGGKKARVSSLSQLCIVFPLLSVCFFVS